MARLPKEKWHQGWTELTWNEHVVTVRACCVFFFFLGVAVALAALR